VLYNIRTGLFTGTLAAQYDICEQLDQLGIPYDVLVEEDLSDKNADWLNGYAAVIVPGGEFDEKELAGLKRYVQNGGHLILIYSAVVIGPENAANAAMATVQPKIHDLVKSREPLEAR